MTTPDIYSFFPDGFSKALYDDIKEAVVVADLERRIIGFNPGAEALFGYIASEVLGHKTEILYASADDFQVQGQTRYNVQSKVDEKSYQVHYKKKDGTVFPSETLGIKVKDKAGQVMGFIGLIRDISERAREEACLQKLYDLSSDQTLNGAEKIQKILELGAEFFDLPIGIVSHIQGNDYTVVKVTTPDNALEPGTHFPVDETYCSQVLKADGPVAYYKASQSDIKDHPCYINFQLEAYIGAP